MANVMPTVADWSAARLGPDGRVTGAPTYTDLMAMEVYRREFPGLADGYDADRVFPGGDLYEKMYVQDQLAHMPQDRDPGFKNVKWALLWSGELIYNPVYGQSGPDLFQARRVKVARAPFMG